MGKKLLPLLLLFSLVFAGCLANPTTEDRLSCLELTSYAFTSIPQCKTQDECFSRAQAALGFDESSLNSITREELLGAKNHLARSWLFLNNARANLKNIHALCYSESYLGIPMEVNELNSNLTTVGKEIDFFNKSAARAINTELTSMELDDINVIAQEPLFDDYSVLNQNVVGFSAHNSSGKTYASRFIREAEKFNTIAQTLSLQGTLQQTSLFGIVSENKSAAKELLAESSKKRDFPLQIIAPVFYGISDFLRDFFALGGSLQSLKALPSFDVLSSINSLVGSDNSAASEFFSVFKSDAEHRNLLNLKNSGKMQRASSELPLLESGLEMISASLKSIYTQDYLDAGLASSGFEEFPVSEPDPRNFYSAYSARINFVKSRLRSLEQAEFLGTITLGAKTTELIEILEENSRIANEMDYFTRLSSGALSACAESLLLAESKISSKEFESGDAAVLSLKAKLASEISDFKAQNRLSGCIAALADFRRLEEYIKSENPSAKAAELIAACIIDAQQLGPFAQSAELSAQLNALNKIVPPYANPELVLSSCTSLKQRLLTSAQSSAESASATQKFSTLSNYVSILAQFAAKFPSLPSEPAAKKLQNSFTEISSNFTDSGIKSESIAQASELGAKLESLNADAEQTLKSLASEAVEKYSKIDYPQNPNPLLIPSGVLSASQSFARISFENIPREIPLSVISAISLNSRDAAAVFSTGNIGFAAQGEKTSLRFTGLLPGINSIVLDLNAFAQSAGAKNPEIPLSAGAEKIISEKDSILKNAAQFSGDKKPEIDFFSQKIDFLAKQGLLDDAAKALALLKETYSGAEVQAQEALKKKADSYAEKFGQLAALRTSLAKNSKDLLDNFSSLGAAIPAEIAAYIPITGQRAKELSVLAAKQIPQEKEFAALMQKGDFAGAISLAEKTGLDEQITLLDSANSESENAIEKIRQNAISSYELASEKSKSSPASAAAEQLLLKSRDSLGKKSYLSSLLNSSNALAVLPSGNQNLFGGFEIPLPVYPLALVVVAAGIYAWKKKSVQKPAEPSRVKKANEENQEDAEPLLF